MLIGSHLGETIDSSATSYDSASDHSTSKRFCAPPAILIYRVPESSQDDLTFLIRKDCVCERPGSKIFRGVRLGVPHLDLCDKVIDEMFL
jgi:hypothetical protein